MTFYDSTVKIAELDGKPHTLKYSDILYLAEDSQYYYLFITNEAAYMVPKEQLRDEEVFRKTVESKSGKKFSRPGGLFSLCLSDIKGFIRK